MKALGAIPSFLTISLFNQGDDLAPIFGAERMATTNATASMQRPGIPFTLSHDAPVTPPEILPLVWAATQRTTQGGQVLAPEQRIDAYTALRAVTADAAFQIREETTKGTLEVGKLADFVVLDRNPLKIPAAQIRDVEVVQTIKEGRAVFTA
jgi:predicted amidohydrolase YtcJ